MHVGTPERVLWEAQSRPERTIHHHLEQQAGPACVLASGLPVSLSSRMSELTWVRSWANSRTARMQIDKAAANRFISAAISSSRAAVDPNYTPASDDETGSPAAGPSGTHTRFTEAEKEDLDRLLEDHDVSDEEEDSDPDAEDSVVEEMLRGARNGLEQAKQTRKDVEAATGTSSARKKKRKAMDPFAGEQSFLSRRL